MGQSFSTDSTTKPIPTGINDYLFSEFCRDSTNLDIYNILSNDIQLQVNVYKHYFQYKNGESLSSLGTQIYLSDILPADIKAIFLQISSYLAI
jgi:hypothetical protein